METGMRYGSVVLRHGYSFKWMASADGEISGFIEDSDGRMVGGSCGWWRTKNPDVAADAAQKRFVPE